MKKFFLAIAFINIALFTSAQLGNVLKHAKDKAASTANNKANSTVDNTVDKTVNGTDANDPNNTNNTSTNTNANQNTPANNTTQSNTNNNTGDTTGKETAANTAPVSIKAYSKYDFVPGEKVIVFEDFSNGNIGDFPGGWNTNAAAEIVTIEGKEGRWLWLTKPGMFLPELAQPLPEDFTFEFDLLHGIPIHDAHFTVAFVELPNPSDYALWPNAVNHLNIELNNPNTGGADPGVTRFGSRINDAMGPGNSVDAAVLNDKNNPVHIAIWRQKERVRVYANQEKIWDFVKAASKDAKFNTIIFSISDAEENIQHYITNLRLAVGAPDTRNKFLTENKWVTHGILFDVNSANIKPESYGTLKEMATVLKENPDLKVKIVGHTDSDGSDATNLDLSKRRAAAVKDELASDFGIDASRMETDGKGESEPIDKNDTPAGKANNRRVEFIKLQ